MDERPPSDATAQTAAKDNSKAMLQERKIEALTVLYERLNGLLENIPDLVWAIDARTLQFNYVSPASRRVLGYSPSELSSRKIEGILSQPSRQKISEAVKRRAARDAMGKKGSRAPLEMELSHFHQNGSQVRTSTLLSFLYHGGEISEILGVSRDITRQHQEVKALAENEQKYRTAFENTVTAMAIIEDDTTISAVNREFEVLSGYARADIEGKLSFVHFVPEPDKQRIIEFHCLRRSDTPLVPRSYETGFRTRDGAEKPVYITEALIPRTRKSIASLFDLSEIREAKRAYQRHQAFFYQLFGNSPQAIMMVDPACRILEVNQGFEALFGYGAAEAVNRYGHQLLSPPGQLKEHELYHQAAVAGKSFQREVERKAKDGRIIPVNEVCFPIQIGRQVEGIFYVFTDISERKAFEEQLRHQAFHDALTGIPNRLLFMDRLERAVERGKRRRDYLFAVILIDLDRFKSINDSLGHVYGDQYLQEMARRLTDCIRSADTVSRLGGDEFAILIEEFESESEVIKIAERIQKAAETPFRIQEHEVFTSASTGIVLQTRNYSRAEEILRDADIAMYRAKARGKGRYTVFNESMLAEMIETVKMENDLRNAVHNAEFELYYQPILSLEPQELIGFEALIRWHHPQQGLIMPARFIPVAEETGLIIPIGQWVLRQACRQMKAWRDAFPEAQGLTMSVNLSLKQFAQKDLRDFIAEVLRENGLPPGCLKLELTESVLMDNSASVLNLLRELKDIGLQLMIDDFGTGYSSLSYLQQFPVDFLKIDRSFVGSMIENKESLEIIKTIVALAKSLGIKLVAEGIEEEAQMLKLKELSCDSGQGFFFARPADSQKVLEYFEKYLTGPTAAKPPAS